MMLLRIVLAAGFFLGLVTAAQSQTAPSPSPGPCAQTGAIGAIVDRPGLGRPTANNGSPCVVPAHDVMVEFGYRDQSTVSSSGTSVLQIVPLALVRVGLDDRMELIAQPPAISTRSGDKLGGVFVPASGTQDAGFGFKRLLDDRATFQDAVGAFYTAPTGTPQGTAGFSAGAPTYTVTYTAAFALSGNLGIAVTQSEIANAAPLSPRGATHFFAYQPSLTLGYGFARNFTLLASEQLTSPAGPNAGTGNRALLALQRVISRHLAVDAEYEVNALPAAPVSHQHAFGFGAAVEL